ncbi:penicillin-binding protein 2 [Pseudobdellovibrio exovorus]|uniref:Penicillin-binding protein n=1 Tax=Pseudobdellovibrio exovorus JSS TaxID=1184267 RepID=M4VAZ4_9BACT|nr:penicillin-binding protein 2 [Pseudobdellovibrio exovorus]AGH95196.1 penicillin-binding protein [Pseudobdellovibrio exovorus JSS]
MSEYISNPDEAKEFQSRYRTMGIFVVAILLIYMMWLAWLQIFQGNRLRQFSENNRIKQNKISAPRGLILDRDGKALVENLPGFEVIISPQYVENLKELAGVVGPILDIEPEKIIERFKRNRRINGPFATIRLKDNLSREEVFRLKRIRLDTPGLEIRESIIRHYPLRENGAQLFGYVGEISRNEISKLNEKYKGSLFFEQGDIVGKSGLEENLEEKIRGQDGVSFIQVDAHGRKTITEIPNIYGQQIIDLDPVHGNSAYLTIDRDIQEAAYKSFTDLKRIGALVAMRSNGEILAWLNSPSFDPNYFATEIPARVWNKLTSDPFKPLRNKVIQDHFWPGSTFKPLVALAALQEKVITDKTVIFAPGRMYFGNRWYHNHNKNGEGHINVYDAIERSSNVFFYQLGIKLGVDKMYNYISLLGLGSRTQIEMEREAAGRLPSSAWKKSIRGEDWQPGENLTMAIGQGYVTVTPLQLAIAYNTIATDGKVVKPFIIKKVVDHDGNVLVENSPEILRDVTLQQPNGYKIDRETFDVVKEGMRRVANGTRGTARSLKIPGVQMAGKTGTAQVMSFSADQIYKSCESRPIHMRHHGWYVAWAPWDKPEVIVAVLAQHSCHGNPGAAPIVRDVIEAYFQKYHPDVIANALKKGDKRVHVPTESSGD